MAEIMTSMTTINCAACSILFAVPKDFEERRRADHGEFKCPAGHVNYFPQKTDLERAREALKQEQNLRAQAEARVRQRDGVILVAERRIRAQKGLLTKCKKAQK